jgi:anti-sigma factor RsiW
MAQGMNCHDLHTRLEDVLEGTGDAAGQQELEAHLASCAACRQIVADVGRIRQTAATLVRRSLPPGAWERLQHRLQNDEALAALQEQPRRASQRPTWIWMGAAAALIVSLTIGLVSMNRARQAEGAATAAGNTTPSALVQSIESELQQAASHYENAIKGLEQVANATDSPLDPQVMATLKQNLAVIDTAINESRGALRTQPGNQIAQENLLEAFRRKLLLLQDTIALMNEMRKGDEQGTARVVTELNKS